MKLGEVIYQDQAGGEEGPQTDEAAADEAASEADDDIVDADFEEVDEEKK